jgi:hypothetical protein
MIVALFWRLIGLGGRFGSVTKELQCMFAIGGGEISGQLPKKRKKKER